MYTQEENNEQYAKFMMDAIYTMHEIAEELKGKAKFLDCAVCAELESDNTYSIAVRFKVDGEVKRFLYSDMYATNESDAKKSVEIAGKHLEELASKIFKTRCKIVN